MGTNESCKLMVKHLGAPSNGIKTSEERWNVIPSYDVHADVKRKNEKEKTTPESFNSESLIVIR